LGVILVSVPEFMPFVFVCLGGRGKDMEVTYFLCMLLHCVFLFMEMLLDAPLRLGRSVLARVLVKSIYLAYPLAAVR